MKKVIIPDDLITLMVSEKKIDLLLKALTYYTPKKEEESEYKELMSILETISMNEY